MLSYRTTRKTAILFPRLSAFVDELIKEIRAGSVNPDIALAETGQPWLRGRVMNAPGCGFRWLLFILKIGGKFPHGGSLGLVIRGNNSVTGAIYYRPGAVAGSRQVVAWRGRVNPFPAFELIEGGTRPAEEVIIFAVPAGIRRKEGFRHKG